MIETILLKEKVTKNFGINLKVIFSMKNFTFKFLTAETIVHTHDTFQKGETNTKSLKMV